MRATRRFLGLERTHRLMQTHSLSFEEAREAASAGLVFTTHTPVPAGHDRFSPAMMEHYFGEFATQKLRMPWNDFMALGRQNPFDYGEPFCMTILALRTAAFSNGVSRLHGEVSREMWQGLWPGVPTGEIPITHVTNGVHLLSWLSRDLKTLFDRYLGPHWREEPVDATSWRQVEHIARRNFGARTSAAGSGWSASPGSGCANSSSNAARRRAKSRRPTRCSIPTRSPSALRDALPHYKRATLLMSDPERLARLLNDPERPVQFIFAGKAHPYDNPGKELISRFST
jgi:starch phosphorylase